MDDRIGVVDFATANPMDIISFSEELIPLAEEMTQEYYDKEDRDDEDLHYRRQLKETKTAASRAKQEALATDYRIYPAQYVAANVFMSTEGVTALQARMGSGKTLMAAAAALLDYRVIIIAPDSTILTSVWITECEEYGLYNTDPELSIFHTVAGKVDKQGNRIPPSTSGSSVMAAHMRYLNKKKFSADDRVVLLCKNKSVHEALHVMLNVVGMGDRKLTVIVDEGHKPIKELVKLVQPLFRKGILQRELLMSGSKVNTKHIGFDKAARDTGYDEGYTIDHRMIINYTPPIPKAIWHFHQASTAKYNQNPEEWNKIIADIVDDAYGDYGQKPHHAVLVGTEEEYSGITGVPRTVSGVSARAYKIEGGPFGGKTSYAMSNAKTKLDQFGRDRDAVLFLNKKKIEGMNITAGDSMIILNAGENNINSIQQLAARILRPKNPNKTVHIHCVNGSDRETYKCIYAKAFAYPGWELDFAKDANVGMIGKGIALARTFGTELKDINDVDMCILLADFFELREASEVGPQEMIAWWKEFTPTEKLPTILDEAIITAITG